MCLVWLSWSRILESEGSLCMGFRTDSAAVRNTTCELSSLNFNQCLHGCFKLYLVVSMVLLTYTTYCFDLPVVWHTPTPLSWIPAVGEPSVNDDNNGVIFYKMLKDMLKDEVDCPQMVFINSIAVPSINKVWTFKWPSNTGSKICPLICLSF